LFPRLFEVSTIFFDPFEQKKELVRLNSSSLFRQFKLNESFLISSTTCKFWCNVAADGSYRLSFISHVIVSAFEVE